MAQKRNSIKDIPVGSRVSVKVVKEPTSVSAAKTIARVLYKDQDIAAEHKRLEKVRRTHFNPQPRGGRLYGGQLVKQHPAKGEVGESGTVHATIDVLRDLASVERFVEVKTA